jgi:hypothetical protein
VTNEWLFVGVVSAILGGAGIVTQPSFLASKAPLISHSHCRSRACDGSRYGLDWGGCCWWASTSCALGHSTLIYAIPVLLATFLDEYWRSFASIFAYRALWWLFTSAPLPDSVNIMRAMGQNSPMLTHTMPWAAMAFSVGLAAVLFLAALKIVQRREY